MKRLSSDDIDNQLWELQKACNRYKNIDAIADFVLFAVTRHINTCRATTEFLYAFINYPVEDMESLIKKCLNGDTSDDGIMKTIKNTIMK